MSSCLIWITLSAAHESAQLPVRHPDSGFDKGSELSAEEERIRKALEEEARRYAPTHRLHWAGDRRVEGILLAESKTSLRLKQVIGPDNEITASYPRSEILTVEALPALTITPSDVRLKIEFPRMAFFKRPPYSVVTDESYFPVRNAMNAVERLHDQFKIYFKDWAGPPASLAIQIVFFSDQEAFRLHARRRASYLESASGFYSAEQNRLVLFNQTASEDLKEFRAKVADLRRQWETAFPEGLPASLAAHLHRMENQGMEYTYLVIRHEGAHQLLRSYGILTARPPIPWVEEGVAAFCETPSLGSRNEPRIQELKQVLSGTRLLPWRSLVEYRAAEGFLGRDPDWSKAAYAQSWLLVYSLMTRRQAGFFKFLKALNAPAGVQVSSRIAIADQLSQSVGASWTQLEAEWTATLKQLTAE